MTTPERETDLRQFLPNADLLDLAAAPHLWNINSIEVGATATRLTGWCLPHGGRLDNSALVVNGGTFPLVRSDKPAGQYAELYPWHPNAAFASFTVDIPHSILDLRSADEFEFRAVPRSGTQGYAGYSLQIKRSDLSFEPPDAVIAARIGVGEALHYTMFGRSIFRGFDAALRRATGGGFEKAGSIVDWGSGSGRVSRHIVGGLRSGQTFRGFDIDAPAIAWSNTHIGPHFHASTIAPPLDVASESVDVVVAYSVFTHLSEAAFHQWLSELKRIFRPGGTLLFTVLGDFSMASLAPTFPRVAHERWRERGIYDDSANRQLETIEVGGDVYRNTWVKRAFISQALGRAGLKHIETASPFHFYQDLVVARRL